MTRSSPSHLTVLLAMGLGASLTYAFSVTDAVGYPAGASVSKGANPVFTVAGVTHVHEPKVLFTAPSDQAVIITDVSLGVTNHTSENCRGAFETTAYTDTGRTLGQYMTGMSNLGQAANNTTTHSYNTGLRVDPGETLNLSFYARWQACDWHEYRVNYVFSGYYAQP